MSIEASHEIPPSARLSQTTDAATEPLRAGRDAAVTQRALVRAARNRFATDGYQAVTVRQIAADVGVNVSLINRYFGSKEGLFEACIRRTSDELDAPAPDPGSEVSDVIDRLIARAVNAPAGDEALQFLLLLRSSGDANADRIRRTTLQRFTQRLARTAGWDPADADTAPIILRAQVAISVLCGVVMLRASVGVEPVASSTPEELARPLRLVFGVLLDPPADDAPR